MHEYSIFAMKLRLNDEYTIAFPIAVCEPLNADFDGDTVSIQLVPEEVAEDTYNKMSPRYVNTYKKNNEPIFKFNHETLEILLGAEKINYNLSENFINCWKRFNLNQQL